jgi:hypothetical protein
MNDIFKVTYNDVISEYSNQPLREDISSQEIVSKLILVARDHWGNMQELLKNHCHSGSSIYNIVDVNSDEEEEKDVDRRNDVRKSFNEVNLEQITHNGRFKQQLYDEDTQSNFTHTTNSTEKILNNEFRFDQNIFTNALRDLLYDQSKMGKARKNILVKKFTKSQELLWRNKLQGIDCQDVITLEGNKYNVMNLNNLGLKPVFELCDYRNIRLANHQMRNI